MYMVHIAVSSDDNVSITLPVSISNLSSPQYFGPRTRPGRTRGVPSTRAMNFRKHLSVAGSRRKELHLAASWHNFWHSLSVVMLRSTRMSLPGISTSSRKQAVIRSTRKIFLPPDLHFYSWKWFILTCGTKSSRYSYLETLAVAK